MAPISTDAVHLLIESWVLFVVTLAFIAARMISRRLLLGGWSKLQTDDYIMMGITVTLAMVMVSVNMVAQNLSNYLQPGMFETFSPQEVQNAVYGSKFVFILEQFQLATLWLCKACLLILYSSMTSGLPKQHRLVKIVGGYCVLGYLVTNILFLAFWCRPIQQYWQVPVDNPQCASYYHHLITSSVFNITSDLIMLLIPLPLLLKARLPFKRKVILCGIFSLGVFVILAAILNRYYNFTEPYGSLVYLNWYAGEASTAVMVANVPHCWPILSRVFKLGSFKATSAARGNSSTNRYKFTSTSGAVSSSRRRYDEHGYMRSESDERLADAAIGPGFASTPGPSVRRDSIKGTDDVELGNVDQHDQHIGNAVSAGVGKSDHGDHHRGAIVKTMSIDQTYSDDKH